MKGSVSQTGLVKRLLDFSCWAAYAVIAIGCTVLLAWSFDSATFWALFANPFLTNPGTAVGLIFGGFSLLQLRRLTGERSRRGEAFGRTLAVAIVLVGAAKLAETIFEVEFHIDKILFPKRLAVGPDPLVDMGVASAVNFVLCGLGLLLLDAETPRGFRPAQGLAMAAALIALLALIGHSYRVLSVYRVGSVNPMSLAAAAAFSFLSLGILAARPEQGMMRVFTSATTGGAVARRLLPMAILIPWALGAWRLLGEEAGYFHAEFGISSLATTTIVVFTLLIWWNAKLLLYKADTERARTERRLAVQYNATLVLAEAHQLETAMRKILQAVCETLDWEVGAMWSVDDDTHKAHCVEIWRSPEAAHLEGFVQATKQSVFHRGQGLPGKAWDSGQPIWIQDVVPDQQFSRAELAARAGLHSAFVFPILSGPKTCGVMEFFNDEIEHPDPPLLQMFAVLGGQIGQFIERQRAEEQVRHTSADLQRSNTDLQQFAYVASHDLSEPLRMVISYLQLLAEKQKGRLDKQTEEFLRFAVDGAHRMQALIKDLLAYSRVDVRPGSFENTDGEQALRAAISNLKIAIDESGAIITHDRVPKLRADPVQLTQVFQNLIGNAIKFRGTQLSRIHVSAQAREREWLFGVRDNGIGIEPKNFERIFVIFQRLHTRQEHPGTGMGLAIVKRIIERHGGRIWLESTPGQGSTFFFTLPALDEA